MYSLPPPLSASFRYNAYSYLGSDEPDVVSSGRSQNNVFSQNSFAGAAETIKIKEADGTQFLDNVFEVGDADGLVVRFDNATGNLMQGNTGLDDGEFELKVDNDACFDGESDSGYEPVC
ncbi:MEP22d [Ectocarpus sp. CCAP 1310/34]|nr:MEP22d [Ectocarpus sp. CCAP 1310/34]